tara:strand:- start:7 stop:657 length:651 start_codon:yes stop_codon:yes gene_type:complete
MHKPSRSYPILIIATLIGSFLLLTGSLYAQHPLFKRPAPRIFESPDGLFKVQLPGKWQVTEFRPGQSATLKPAGARPETQLIIQRIEVPPGAHPRLLRLKAVENRLGKLAGFRELAKADAVVSGFPAASITASYHYQGNIQYPRAIEEVFIVAGNEAFILHFECFEPDGSAYAQAVGIIYQSLQFRPNQNTPPKGSEGQKSQQKEEPAPFVDKVTY